MTKASNLLLKEVSEGARGGGVLELVPGETLAERLGAGALADGTPWSLQSLLRRGLEKDPRRRFHDMAECGSRSRSRSRSRQRSRQWEVAVAQPAQWKRAIPWSVAAAIAVMAAVAIGSSTRPGPRPLSKFCDHASTDRTFGI